MTKRDPMNNLPVRTGVEETALNRVRFDARLRSA